MSILTKFNAMKQNTNSEVIRKRELAQIHIAKSDLGLDDDTYRAMLMDVARMDSAARLNANQRQAVLERFKSKGWINKKQKGMPTKSVDSTKKPLMSKIGALLADMKLPWSYADGIRKQMNWPRRLEWCSEEQLKGVVAALIKHQKKLQNPTTCANSQTDMNA